MAGNENSGRKNMFDEAVQVHFYMERGDVEKLNEIAKKYSNNNRSELIKQTLKRVIKAYDESK